MGQALVTIAESQPNDSRACPMDLQQGINMDRRRLEMTVLMTPEMANFGGKVHGGPLLNLGSGRLLAGFALFGALHRYPFKEPFENW